MVTKGQIRIIYIGTSSSALGMINQDRPRSSIGPVSCTRFEGGILLVLEAQLETLMIVDGVKVIVCKVFDVTDETRQRRLTLPYTRKQQSCSAYFQKECYQYPDSVRVQDSLDR